MSFHQLSSANSDSISTWEPLSHSPYSCTIGGWQGLCLLWSHCKRLLEKTATVFPLPCSLMSATWASTEGVGVSLSPFSMSAHLCHLHNGYVAAGSGVRETVGHRQAGQNKPGLFPARGSKNNLNRPQWPDPFHSEICEQLHAVPRLTWGRISAGF